MKKIIYHPLTIIFLSLIAVYFIFSLRSNQNKIDLSKKNIKNLKQIVSKMEISYNRQAEELKTAKKPLTKEKVVRNELLMKKPGEYILQLPEINPAQPEKTIRKEKTPWEKWRNLLFD